MSNCLLRNQIQHYLDQISCIKEKERAIVEICFALHPDISTMQRGSSLHTIPNSTLIFAVNSIYLNDKHYLATTIDLYAGSLDEIQALNKDSLDLFFSIIQHRDCLHRKNFIQRDTKEILSPFFSNNELFHDYEKLYSKKTENKDIFFVSNKVVSLLEKFPIEFFEPHYKHDQHKTNSFLLENNLKHSDLLIAIYFYKLFIRLNPTSHGRKHWNSTCVSTLSKMIKNFNNETNSKRIE